MSQVLEPPAEQQEQHHGQNGATHERLAREFSNTRVPLDRFPPNERLIGEKPTGELVQQIIAFGGLRVPVEYVQDEAAMESDEPLHFDDPKRLTAGNRRVRASREAVALLSARLKTLGEQFDRAEDDDERERVGDEIEYWQNVRERIVNVPTRILWGKSGVAPVATIVDHSTRRENDARVLAAVEALIEQQWDDDRIARETSLAKGTIKRIRRLQRLVPELRRAFDEGRISTYIAHRSARLSEGDQNKLLEVLNEKGRLTIQDVNAVRSVGRAAAVARVTESDDDLGPEDTGAEDEDDALDSVVVLRARIVALQAKIEELEAQLEAVHSNRND